MPIKASHSSTKLGLSSHKRPNSHLNLVPPSAQISSNSITPAHSPIQQRLAATHSQATLVPINHIRSRHPQHKKRPSQPIQRSNSAISFQKQISSTTRKKPILHRPHKKGAFKGALDADLDDDDFAVDQDPLTNVHPLARTDLQQRIFNNNINSSKLTLPQPQPQPQPLSTVLQPLSNKPPPKDDEAWVSEPSTRSPSPSHQSPPIHPLRLPQDSLATQSDSLNLNLNLQLPNPLPSVALPILPSTPTPSSSIQPALTECYQTSHGDQISVTLHARELYLNHKQPPTPPPALPERRGRSRSRNRLQDSIERVQRLERSLVANENGSVAVPEPGQPPRTASPPGPQQASPTLPSLSPRSSLIVPTTTPIKGKAKAERKPSGKRTSINSIRSLSSLVNFHHDAPPSRAGLKRVDSALSVVLPPKVDTTEAVMALTSKPTGAFNPTLGPIADLPGEQHLADWAPRRRREPATAATSPQESLYDRKRISPDCSAGSSASPLGAAPPAPQGGGLSTLDRSEFAQRLKKYSRPADDSLKHPPPEVGLMSSLLSPRISFKPPSKRTALTPGPSSSQGSGGYFDSFKSLVGLHGASDDAARDHAWRATVRGSSSHSHLPLPEAAASAPTPSQSVGGPFAARAARMRAGRADAKPALAGLVTTCGSVPVVSRFIEPRSAEPAPRPAWGGQPVVPEGNAGAGRARSAEVGSLTRIQKRLLMERDRPVSPDRHALGGEGWGQGRSGSCLPPPSYLIRSLGGQTGPLPLIPVNLIGGGSGTPTTTVGSPTTTTTTTPTSRTTTSVAGALNEPAQRMKQAQSVQVWRNSLIDEVEQVLTDHESNVRFRDPLVESFDRVLRGPAGAGSGMARWRNRSRRKFGISQVSDPIGLVQS